MEPEFLFAIGIILITGYFFGLVAEKLGLPRVTSYLMAGILFSDELMGHKLGFKISENSEFLISTCLGLIAYIIGSKIKIEEFVKEERKIVSGTIFEIIFAGIFVYGGFLIISMIFDIPPKIGIILTSLAATTAPASTLAVIEQYKAKGELTNTILGIVALDDALGIIFFSVISTIALGGSLDSGLIIFGKEIVFALISGTILGLMLSKFAKLSKTDDYLFPLLIGLIFLSEYLAQRFHFSSLLACMVLGVISCNTFHKEDGRVSLLLPIQHIEEFVFIIFFTLAGTHFSVSHLQVAGPYIFSYVLLRALGKYIGAYLGISLGSKGHNPRAKWAGLALFPQAGVAIGLTFVLIQNYELNGLKVVLLNTVLGSTIIYEVIGPIAAKLAFKKVGEIETST